MKTFEMFEDWGKPKKKTVPFPEPRPSHFHREYDESCPER